MAAAAAVAPLFWKVEVGPTAITKSSTQQPLNFVVYNLIKFLKFINFNLKFSSKFYNTFHIGIYKII